MKTLQRILWPLLAFASPAALLPTYFQGNWYSFFHGYSLGMALGVISFAWLVVTLVLCARIPYFDRLYGHDRVLVFHGYLAGGAILAGFIHSRIKEFYLGDETLQAKIGGAAMLVFLLVAVLTHLFMAGSITRWLPFTTRITARIRKVRLFDYSRVKLLHNLMALALAAIIVHILLAAPTMENPLRMWAMGSWGGLGITVYLYFRIVKLIILHLQGQRITAVTAAAPGITRLTISNSVKPRPLRAGQFAYLRILSQTTGTEEHPFTVSSAPDDDGITFTVKNLGDYTARLGKLAPGTKVLVDAPFGIFTPERTPEPHLFIAGGIGITPFLSIIADMDRRGFTGPVTLLWSVRTEQDLVDRKLLEDIAERHERFTFIPVITGHDGKRIGRGLLAAHVQPGTTAWYCGPEGMRKNVAGLLKKLGIKRIRYERFSA